MMKGFMVVDRLNDINFIDTDKEFARHINEQAKESGLLDEGYKDMYTVDPNIVMQQFSPLFMSQWFMIDHAKNPCSSIRCENDFLFVFKQFEDYLLVAINGDGTENEDFLTRKTLVFMRLIDFLIGPVSEEIGKPKFCTKSERWSFLRVVLSTWTYLAKNEQSFLVEAVEKLHMNQVVSEQCVEVLQTAVTSMEEAGERKPQHALILVNTKLLSLYSIRNAQELQSSDILCIILLVRSLFPSHEKLEDLFAHLYKRTAGDADGTEGQSPASVRIRNQFRGERYESAVEGFTDGDDTENEDYYSALENKGQDDSSPSPHGWNFLNDSDSGGKETPYPEVSERFVTPTTTPDGQKNGKKTFDIPQAERSPMHTVGSKPSPGKMAAMFERPSKGKSMRGRSYTDSEIEVNSGAGVKGSTIDDFSVGRGRSKSFGENNPRKKEPVLCSERSKSDTRLSEQEADDSATVIADDTNIPIMQPSEHVKQAVFLKTALCKYSPYQIHCRRIYPGIILVVLSEMGKVNLAPKLADLLAIFKEMLDGQRDSNPHNSQYVYDALNKQLYVVFSSLKKSKGQLERLCWDIQKKWEKDNIKTGIRRYLEQGPHREMPASLERGVKFIHSKLTEIFCYLYLLPRPLTPAVTTAMTSVTSIFMSQLGDYKEYLAVKAQRNITMTTYIEDFPGLIHFIYINRRTNQIMAPALNITQAEDTTRHDATQLLKEKIWCMTSWMLMKLHEGNTMISAREGDFRYSYFLWFENCSGEPVVIQRPYRADCSAPPPGILTGNFYRYVTHKCFPNVTPNSVHCNELVMMHVGLANTHYVANQCRQLAARLYETSGDMLTNASLFGT